MLQQKINFEWNIGDDDFGALVLPSRFSQIEAKLARPPAKRPWKQVQALTVGQPWLPSLPIEPGQFLSAGEARFLWQRLRDLFLLALATVILSSMPFTPAQIEQRRVEAGVAAALDLEYAAWQRKDRLDFTALLDLPAVERWQWEWRDYWALPPADFANLGVTLRRVDRQADLVRVETLVTRPSTKWWRSSPYREIRFYRESAEGWLRTIPADSYWGAPLVAESEHLRFEYRAADAATIEPQVARLQTIYLELCDLVGLDPATPHKWTFVLEPDRADGRTGYYYVYEYTSPALSEVPDTLTDQEFVAQMMVSTMASRAVYGVSPTRRNFLHRWEMVVWSLYGWLRSDLLDQRSPWHAQAQAVFGAALADHMPLTLDDIEEWQDDSRPGQERVMRQYMVSESIIDFALTTYGRDKLSALLEGMEEARGWDELTSRVFGVSASDFEAAWNRYLTKSYLD